MSVNKNRLRNKNQKVTFKKIFSKKKKHRGRQNSISLACVFFFKRNILFKVTFWFLLRREFIYFLFWTFKTPFGTPKLDICELVQKYQSCIRIRRSIWHPLWHTWFGGWHVWHIATSQDTFMPNANRPIWHAKSSIFFFSLLARIFNCFGSVTFYAEDFVWQPKYTLA